MADLKNVAMGPIRAGRVKSIFVRVGQVVHKGDILFNMDEQELEAQRTRIRKEIDLAKAKANAEWDIQESDLLRNELARIKPLQQLKR